MKYSLIKSITGGHWHLNESVIMEHIGAVSMILQHGTVFKFEDDGKNRTTLHANINNPQQIIAIHNIDGVILLDDQECGYRGTETLIQNMVDIEQSFGNLTAHVFRINSGGGESRALQPFKKMLERSEVKKPIYSSVNFMAASAGYGIASFGKKINAEQADAVVGSIGTMIQFAAWPKDHSDTDGARYLRIYASESTKKNKAFEDAIEGRFETMLEERLDPANERFIEMIKTNRDKVTEEYFDGRDIEAGNAMGVLVDSQMHFEDFLNEIFETENNLTITTMSNTENKNVFAVLGVNTLEFDAENYTALNAAQIGLLNSALAAKETATESTANQKTIEELQAIVDETNQANAELKTSMDTMKSELDAVKQENEELSNSALSPKKVNPKGTTETKRIQGSMSIHEKMAVMKENYGSILK